MEEKAIRVYSNFAGLAMSTFDMTCTFALKRGDSDPLALIPEEVVAEVVMSPQHAKAFALALGNHLRQYEAAFGIINLEPKVDSGAGNLTE